MRPHRNLGWHMNKPEMTRLALPRLAIVSVDNVEVEKRVIVARVILRVNSCEFLIGGH